MLIDITQTTLIGKEYRTGSPALRVERITCNPGTPSEYKTYTLTAATHNLGTHLDMMGIDIEIPLHRLISKGIKYNVTHITDRAIQLKDLDLTLIKEGLFVFFQTGWDQYLHNDTKYSKHPEISIEVIQYLSDKGINMIGIDATGLGRGKNHGAIDTLLGQTKQWAIENLTHLDKLPDSGFTVYCLPMKIQGIDTLPVRILVEIED